MARAQGGWKGLSLAAVVVVIAQVPTGCGLGPPERAVINAWLECDECTQTQRRAVWEIPGARAVGKLEQALLGLEDWKLENLRQQHVATWLRLGGAAFEDSATYVDRYIGNREALIRRRAARSLADIYLTHTGLFGWWARRRARAELEDAIARDVANLVSLRPETRQVLDEQLDRMNTGVSAVETIVITPETTTTQAAAVQLTARVFDELGNDMPNEPITWTVDGPGVASVDAAGLVDRAGTGIVRVRATAGGVAAVATIEFQ